MKDSSLTKSISYKDFKKEVLNDYKTIVISREASLLGRKEVLSGKAKFGIFGDGKELPQVAMSKVFEKGDFRSGYYRDQTFMFSIKELSVEQFFAGLYANTNFDEEPMSGGRQMGSHFSTVLVDENGEFKDLPNQYNISSDISPTSGQMPRLLGLAMASKLFRTGKFNSKNLSTNGNEVAWGTIGNASTSEGLFFETVNAIGVHQVPAVICVWDDDYGISVDNSYQTTKSSISEALKGFQRTKNEKGYEILTVNGWDYPSLISTFEHANNVARNEHVPVLIHVKELTQPVGHSTSGSHERYKTSERLEWEKSYDCVLKMKEWILENGLFTSKELDKISLECKAYVKQQKDLAWTSYQSTIIKERDSLISVLKKIIEQEKSNEIIEITNSLLRIREISRKDIMTVSRKILRRKITENSFNKLYTWVQNYRNDTQPLYSSFLYNEYPNNFSNVKNIEPKFDNDSSMIDGRIILKNNFDSLLTKYPNLIVFGEDTGKIGDVNQGLEGMQIKYGTDRIDDRGIREATIIGEGIGLAMRGLRPIAEIQYLDYLMFALQTLSDDLATVSYRSVGKQLSPLIVRTRGHRLEGMWHAGSPMGMILNSLKGMLVLTPRNMVQAAGMYNTLLSCSDPALIIEPLNAYRLKEKQPTNIGEYNVSLGYVDFITRGKDITVVSYGSTLKLIEKSLTELSKHDIEIELIDLQTLIPLDINMDIVKSLEKTNKLLIVDEDFPGGASSHILKVILEDQDGFKYLDSKPITLTAKEHRTPYGSDGDYFSKPSLDDIFESCYKIMHEYNPKKYPLNF
tara:strand:+ start:3500 stop:5896 length:2397 start_codon:yes stop_codon:yes gene_type:complete